ncbi:MAG: ROK family protein, partial [Caldilineaceae bacterium]|nr:ROK family protein [Caldilineaceae bacterium]
MHPSYPVLAIDIGGTKTAAAVIDERYAVHCRQEIATEAQAGPERVLDCIAELGQSVMAAFQRTLPDAATPHAAGIAIAGQVDVTSGDVLQATENMPGWTGFPAGRRLAAKLRMPVVVDN